MASTTTFTRTVNGQVQTREAHTPAEAVKLRFDGWTEQKASGPKVKPQGSTETPAKTTDTK